ncbi:MAG: FKBP-type peptidyl-prolyl cis-trans isomerase N-terminal domain-containing protein, partial [Clostridia bacterium]|nr:FKBP-type peptidyl-prolyl cis-trans isomerase N-terminal domain-containing protein [Clostridia bacterium]
MQQLPQRNLARAAWEEKMNAENIEKGKAFLAENAKKEGVVTLPSGLQYEV